MSGWTTYRDAIATRIGALPKQVLVVEGEDDRVFIESLLTQRAPGAWEPQWVIGVAGGKSRLLQILNAEAKWFGLVDRDEWTAADAAAQQAVFSRRLFVLPRYCMENYFTVPAELWVMLEPAQQARVANGWPAFEVALTAPIAQWVRHGALWHAVNPLWRGLHSRGFKDALLDFTASQQSDLDIQTKLQEWHTYLDPQPILTSFRANLAAAAALSPAEQATQWVHGKRFFREHIAIELPALIGVHQQSADKTLAELQKRMMLPADLHSIWSAVGLP